MDNKEISQPRKTEPRFFYGYIVVLAAFCIMVIMYGTRVSFGVFFKPMIAEFGWTRALTSGAYSLSTVVQGFMGIVMGGLADRLGPRAVLTLCGVLLGLGYLLMSQLSAVWQLYLFYVLMIGIGMGGVFVPLLSTVARWFVKRRSMMAGIVLAGLGTGSFVMPPVVNRLISIYDWHNSYIVVGCLVLVFVILAAQFLRRDQAQMGQLPYGEKKRGKWELDLGIEGFSVKEAVYTRQLWMVFALFFCTGFSVVTLGVHIVPHATDLGISAATAANILAATGGAGLLSGIIMGGTADRIGNRQVFIICFILMTVASFGLAVARTVWTLYLFTALLSFGGNGSAALESPLVAELFGIRSHGLLFGVIGLGFTIGGAAGPFLAGYIFDVNGSYQLTFLLCAAFGVVGLILTTILRPTKRLGGRI